MPDLNTVAPDLAFVGALEFLDDGTLFVGGTLFVSLTQDMYSGSLNMDSHFAEFPNRLHTLLAEFGFPQYREGK